MLNFLLLLTVLVVLNQVNVTQKVNVYLGVSRYSLESDTYRKQAHSYNLICEFAKQNRPINRPIVTGKCHTC